MNVELRNNECRRVPARRRRYGNYIDEPLVMRQESDSEDYYYAQDHLYSVVALTDDTGTVVERYEYDAYGKCAVLGAGADGDWFTGDDTSANMSDAPIGNPYTFTGRRLDAFDTGNFLTMHYRSRTYDTYTGRFLQQDPVGYVDGASLYQYVRSMPVETIDPMGLTLIIDPLPPGEYPSLLPPITFPLPPITSPWPPPLPSPDPHPVPPAPPYQWWPEPLPGLPEPSEPWIDPGPTCGPWENDGKYYKSNYIEKGGTGMDIIEAVGPLAMIAGGVADFVIGGADALGINLTIMVYNIKLSHPKGQGAYDDMPCKCEYTYQRKCKRTCCGLNGLGRLFVRTKKKVQFKVTGYGNARKDPHNHMRMDCYCSWPTDYLNRAEEIKDEQTQCDQLN